MVQSAASCPRCLQMWKIPSKAVRLNSVPDSEMAPPSKRHTVVAPFSQCSAVKDVPCFIASHSSDILLIRHLAFSSAAACSEMLSSCPSADETDFALSLSSVFEPISLCHCHPYSKRPHSWVIPFPASNTDAVLGVVLYLGKPLIVSLLPSGFSIVCV